MLFRGTNAEDISRRLTRYLSVACHGGRGIFARATANQNNHPGNCPVEFGVVSETRHGRLLGLRVHVRFDSHNHAKYVLARCEVIIGEGTTERIKRILLH